MKASVCIATYDKAPSLRRVLESVLCQLPPFPVEVIVVDDGSPTGETGDVCRLFPEVRLINRWRQPSYGNPAIARNLAYSAARGDVLICQSDDVIHARADTIEQLVHELTPNTFTLATVLNVNDDLQPVGCGHPRNPSLVELCGPKGRRPLFFLGAVLRRHVYEIGGNDERFTAPGKEDRYFVDCLVNGLGLKPYFSSASGYHLHHDRPPLSSLRPSDRLYEQLVREAAAENRWQSRGAPWPYEAVEL